LSNNQYQQNLDWVWGCFCVSVLILPLFPAVAAVGLVVVLIRVWQCHHTQIINNYLNWGLAILSGWFMVNSALAYQPKEAWLGLANLLPFFALFAALSVLISQPKQLRQLSWLLVIPSLPIVILGLGQLFAAWDTPPLLESILGWQLVPQGEPVGRMSSVFIYTNFLAIYLAISFSLTLGLWLENWQVWRQKLDQKRSWCLIVLSVISIADITGLVLTSSRNAWGLAFLSCMAYAVYVGWRWLVWGVTAAATAILWASFAPDLGGEQLRTIIPAFFWARLSDQMYPDRPVATLRITQWEFCWNLIKDRPLVGWGLRNFTPLYETKMNVWFGHPHNLLLMLGAETGILATLLLMGIVGWIIAKAVLLLNNWSNSRAENCDYPSGMLRDRDQLILFSYVIAFTLYILFNLFDVTIFELRVNTLGWILLSAINGIAWKQSQRESAIKRREQL
jgi:O-antigen ligase